MWCFWLRAVLLVVVVGVVAAVVLDMEHMAPAHYRRYPDISLAETSPGHPPGCPAHV